jgi:hypothetical protein
MKMSPDTLEDCGVNELFVGVTVGVQVSMYLLLTVSAVSNGLVGVLTTFRVRWEVIFFRK